MAHLGCPVAALFTGTAVPWFLSSALPTALLPRAFAQTPLAGMTLSCLPICSGSRPRHPARPAGSVRGDGALYLVIGERWEAWVVAVPPPSTASSSAAVCGGATCDFPPEPPSPLRQDSPVRPCDPHVMQQLLAVTVKIIGEFCSCSALSGLILFYSTT